MKHLPKHLRPHWRYLAVEIRTDPGADLDRGWFQRDVWYATQNLLGDPGAAEIDGTVVRFSFDAPVGEAVVRARRGTGDRARAALACVDSIDGQSVRVAVRGVGGTIRACEEKYLGRPGELREERHVVFEDADRSAVVDGDAVDIETGDGVLGATPLDLD